MDDATQDRLEMLLAEAKRVERSARIMKQLAARALGRSGDNSDSQEAHANDRPTDTH